MANVNGDESSLATPVADHGPDPAMPNPGLASPDASAMEMYGLTVPSETVLAPLTTIWDDTEHIEKRVEMGIES